MTRVRAAIPADARAVAAFMLEQWDEAHRGILDDALLDRRMGEPREEREQRWHARLRDDVVLLAEDRGRIVAAVRREDVGGVLGPLLSSLMVAADTRGRGLGAELVRAIIGEGPAHLWTFEGASGAQRFHERQGFRSDGARRQDPFGTERRMVRRAS